MVLSEIIALAVVIGIVLIGVFVFKKIFALAINSVIGFFALFAVQLVLPTLDINVWSVLITAIGGLIGLIIVVVMHLIGIAF